ncbi:MAG: septum formation initiator family protein [Solirubrobacteraceae bacterium]
MSPRIARAGPSARVRWDRLGRTAMLIVLLVLLVLFIGPARSLVSTLSQSSERHAQVTALLRENGQLRARAAALQQQGTLEADARGLDLVKPGERPYVIFHLPAN